MKILYLRDNVVSTTEALVENDGDGVKFVIPPKGFRLVDIQIGSRSEKCAVKKNDYRFTLKDKSVPGREIVNLSKIVWSHKASVLAVFGNPKPAESRKTEQETPKTENGPPNLTSVLPLDDKVSLNHSSGDFEKNFKALVREHGRGSDSLLTATFLVRSMSPGDKAELNNNLMSNGIKTSDDLERLLSKWKSEALLANRGPKRALRRNKTLSAGYER
jgi:hypothetical protein